MIAFVISLIAAIGQPPSAAVRSVAETSGSGDSIMWPMFLLALFAVLAWKTFKYSRRHLVKLPKNWDDQFWADFYEWRGEPENRVG